MDEKTYHQISLTTDQLAEGLTKAREFRQFTLKFCSQLLGIPAGRLRNYEKGKSLPSLPEIEALAFIYGLPVSALFSPQRIRSIIREPDTSKLQMLMNIHHHIISTRLKIAFDRSGKTVKEISKASGMTGARIQKYFNNTSEIPFDDLISLSNALGLEIQSLFDTESSLGQWQAQQERMTLFAELPQDIQEKVIDNANLPYVTAARNLKALDRQSLQALSDALEKILQLQAGEEIAPDQV